MISCDAENPNYNRAFTAYFKIQKFVAIGQGKSDGFSIRTDKCPTDEGNSLTVQMTTLDKN